MSLFIANTRKYTGNEGERDWGNDMRTGMLHGPYPNPESQQETRTPVFSDMSSVSIVAISHHRKIKTNQKRKTPSQHVMV